MRKIKLALRQLLVASNRLPVYRIISNRTGPNRKALDATPYKVAKVGNAGGWGRCSPLIIGSIDGDASISVLGMIGRNERTARPGPARRARAYRNSCILDDARRLTVQLLLPRPPTTPSTAPGVSESLAGGCSAVSQSTSNMIFPATVYPFNTFSYNGPCVAPPSPTSLYLLAKLIP